MSLKKTAVSLALIFSLVNAVQAREINPQETVNEPQAEIIEKEVMTSKVINLDIKVENDNNYIVTALGTLKNNSHLLIRDAHVKVVLMDKKKNILLEVPVNEAINLGPNEEKPFKVSKFVRTNKSPFSIRGQAEVSRSETANVLQIAGWILSAKTENLKYWNIDHNPAEFSSDTAIRRLAVNYLLETDRKNELYDQAMDMINELRYQEALKSAELNDYQGALLNLISINPNRKYAPEATEKLADYRPRIIFEKAKALSNQKLYYQAINLFRTIPPESTYYNQARQELNKVYFIIRSAKIELPAIQMKDYSADQQKVIQTMDNQPETVLSNIPKKNVITWVFPDYSHFSFDESGNLLDYKVYPLY